jgi:anti-anti-sigma factor
MRLTATKADEVLVVTLQEPRLDRTNSARFREAMAAHLRPGVKIALGLDALRYLDGLGCGALLALHKQAVALGGQVRLFSLPQPVRNLCRQIRLHRMVATYNRQEEAVRSFGDRE